MQYPEIHMVYQFASKIQERQQISSMVINHFHARSFCQPPQCTPDLSTIWVTAFEAEEEKCQV